MFPKPLQTAINEIMLESPISKIAPLISMPFSHHLLPFYVQIESTTKCNLRCKTCRREKEPNLDIPLKLYKSIIDQFKSSRFIPRRLDLTGLGEPLLNPNITTMVKYAKEYDFQVSLNNKPYSHQQRDDDKSNELSTRLLIHIF